MKFYNFKSNDPKTPFAPIYDYVLGEDHIGIHDVQYYNNLKELILKKEKQILEETEPTRTVGTDNTDGYTGLGDNSLTSRFASFNVLKWEEDLINPIRNAIKEKYFEFLNALKVERRLCYIQCWTNVLRKGQQIKPHIHGVTPYTYLGGHIHITQNNTSTFYMNPVNQLNDPELHESKNEQGKITIFQNCIPHYTSMNIEEHERISIAFDFLVSQPNLDTKNLIIIDNGESK